MLASHLHVVLRVEDGSCWTDYDEIGSCNLSYAVPAVKDCKCCNTDKHGQ